MSFTKRTTALCRRCGGETKQIVRGGRTVPLSAWFEDDGDGRPQLKEFQTDLAYELYECCSCEYIDLRSSRDLSGASGFTVRFHPQLTSRAVPAWRRDLPAGLTPLVDELYAALGTDSRILAMTGVRMLVDVVVGEKAPGVVSFRGGLAALEELGLLRPRDRDLLCNALIPEGGSAAASLHAPTLDTVNRVMDVVEELLHAAYVRAGAASGAGRESEAREPLAMELACASMSARPEPGG